MIRFFLVVIVYGVAFTSYSQTDSSKWSFDLSARYRFEAWNGMNAKNYSDNSSSAIGSLNDKILLQRVIVGTTWLPEKNIEVAAHIQDSRAFGWSLNNSEYPDLFKVKKQGC